MQFITPSQDRWRGVAGDDGPIVTLTPSAHRLLSLEQWHAVRAHWPAGLPVGVAIANDVDVATLAEDLPRLALVALHFPKWTDGRAYSQAHLLRVRHRYAGQVRATGEVLVDMLPLLLRTGVDAVVLRADQSRAAAERALGFFAAYYQGDVRDPRPLFARPADEQGAAPRTRFVEEGASI
ncbi:DUF934 domain-containing protein [Piscinibacter sakaiensis]|uniref:Oxidoreductase n=1 Tax=Piscinibacter sakaiensis TaxID=1547922 RepID=A0A0K8NZI3_PISS1|nr:DUF934 domain-containing protein [Piscinibacter sakaiensis]GAP35689.1 oxidoreductase [Piscinibacter sakaiensis]